MAVDDRYLPMFVEEARELLAGLEEGLIDLERMRDDPAHLDKTFRAAHSIKGAAAMVGLSALAEFTDGIETVLDRVRVGTLAVNADVIGALLAARDHLAAAVEAEAVHAPIPSPPELVARLVRLLEGPIIFGTKPDPEPDGPVAELCSIEPEAVTYRIRLEPGRHAFERGINPVGIIDELRELGEATVEVNTAPVPPIDEIDPEQNYLAWTLDLRTLATRERVDEAFLFLHEGEVAVERIEQATELAPAPVPVPSAEDAAKPALSVARAITRVRVDSGQLDELVGLAGELAVLSDNIQGLASLPGAGPFAATLEALDRVSRQVRDSTLELRMVPVEELFSRFPRVVRDLAGRSGKEIELRIVGQETRLDRTIVERLAEPMIHLIRNAVDHGLETPAERLAAGKSRVGRITLWAGHEGDRVALRVEEDGRGLNRERIVRRGISRGLVPPGTTADDPRVDSLIFEPGFSTRDKVGELSGRGVGLDVVREAIRALRGSLLVESTPGRGTSFLFRLPLTLALIDGLLVEVAGSRYVVPLAQVEECVALDEVESDAPGRACVAVRGELIPMVGLRKVFLAEGRPPSRQELLLTRSGGRRIGVAVDRLVGRVRAVIQSTGDGLGDLPRFSGATILGDGSVSLILDLAALVAESRENDRRRLDLARSLPSSVEPTPAELPR